MSYSFPVFRRGAVFQSRHIQSREESSRFAKRIYEEQDSYEAAFRGAVQSVLPSGTVLRLHCATNGSRRPKQANKEFEESPIVNFKPVQFRFGIYKISASTSVTVCLYEHQSKVWSRLACLEVDGRPADNLSATAVQRFFRRMESLSKRVLAALFKNYRAHLSVGLKRPFQFEPYYFQFRAFNSTERTSAKLCVDLGQGMSLKEALKERLYSSQLLDYFGIVMKQKVSPARIIRAIETDRLDVFRYKSPKHEALYAVTTDDAQTDLCGFGFDDDPDGGSDVLAQATSRDLLREYAQKF